MALSAGTSFDFCCVVFTPHAAPGCGGAEGPLKFWTSRSLPSARYRYPPTGNTLLPGTLAPGSIDLVTGTAPPTHLIFNHFLFRPRNKALARASLRETLDHPQAGPEPPVPYAPVHAGRRGESGTAYRTHLHATGPFACISLYARIGILILPALAQGVRQWALNWVKMS